MKKVVLCILISMSLLGCGSDESRPGVMPGLSSGEKPSGSKPNQPPIDSINPPAQDNTKVSLLPGIYSGTSNDGNILNGLIDDNKQLWFLYTDRFDNDLGFVGSNDKIKGDTGTFDIRGKNYSYDSRSVADITITGDYKTAKTIIGSIYDRPSNATAYKLTVDNTLSNKAQNLSLLNNKFFKGDSYATTDNEGGKATIFFTTEGKFTGNSEDCSLSGTFTLSGSKRYFITSMTFGNEQNCSIARRNFSGVGLIDRDGDLIILGKNGSIGLYFSTKD